MKRKCLFLFAAVFIIYIAGCSNPVTGSDYTLNLVAYGNVDSVGTIRNGSDNFTTSHAATGYYTIILDPPIPINYQTDIVIVTPIGFSNERNAIWSTTADSTVIGISIFDNDVKVDSSFSFLVYKL